MLAADQNELRTLGLGRASLSAMLNVSYARTLGLLVEGKPAFQAYSPR
jgi:hypothetical protein